MKRLCGVLVALFCVATAAQAADVPGLIKQLKDSDPDLRRQAAKALGEAGKEAAPAVPALLQALKDKDLFVRRFAALALGDIGADPKTVVPALSAVINDNREKKDVQDAAVTALGKLGATSVGPLTATAKDPTKNPQVRRKAVEALGLLGADAKSALPTLLEILNPKGKRGNNVQDVDVRIEAANALGTLATKDDKAVVEALGAIVNDKKFPNRNIKQAAAAALKKIKGKK